MNEATNCSLLGLNSAVNEVWAMSILASCAVGLTGIIPLLFVPNLRTGTDGTKGNPDDAKRLRLLLSFAVGSLLGNIFLHLLPEAWIQLQKDRRSTGSCDLFRNTGSWVLVGMFTFMIVEIMFTSAQEKPEEPLSKENVHKELSDHPHLVTKTAKNGYSENTLTNGHLRPNSSSNFLKSPNGLCKASEIHVSGYLNLLANSIDNFTHGLAVAASFTVGIKMGLLTTASILIHEIPHEVGDFAILLKSGFSRWDAAKAQISTATVGVAGAVAALIAESPEDIGLRTHWILPFTAGGFLNIALVGILPDIMKEKNPWESVKQFLCICIGIVAMASVNMIAR